MRFQRLLALCNWAKPLGMSIATVNRTLHELRARHAVDFQKGVLLAKNWKSLADNIRGICTSGNLCFEASRLTGWASLRAPYPRYQKGPVRSSGPAP
jgi:hypothetical protein